MSDAKHTPGPWEVRATDDGFSIRGDDGAQRVAFVDYNHVAESGRVEAADEDLVNARLIAAAPDLLAAAYASLTTLAIAMDPKESPAAMQERLRAAFRAVRDAVNRAVSP